MSKHIYLLRIDTVCSSCGFRNKGKYRLEEPMDVICCGNCGDVLNAPEDITTDEKDTIEKCVKRTIEENEGGEDAFL